MKKFFHGVTGFLRVLVLLAVGLGLLGVTLGGGWCPEEDCWGWLLEALRPFRTPAMVAGAGLLILELLHLLTCPRIRRSPEHLTFRAKGGGPVISVKTSAIRDAFARVAEEFDGVEAVKTTVTCSRGHIDLDLTVRAVAGTPIPVLCNDLQNRAREVLSQQIGLFDLRQVRVHIQDLLPAAKSSPAPKPAPTPARLPEPDDEAPTRAEEDPL